MSHQNIWILSTIFIGITCATSVTLGASTPPTIDTSLFYQCKSLDSYYGSNAIDLTAGIVIECQTNRSVAYFQNATGTVLSVSYCECGDNQTQNNALISARNYNCGDITYAKSCSNNSTNGDDNTSGTTPSFPGGGTVVLPTDACNSNSDCGTNIEWSGIDMPNGYQKQTSYTCVNPISTKSTCKTSNAYRCADGYYGKPTCTAITSQLTCFGCTKCPTDDFGTGTATAGNNTSINDCYIKPDGTYKDAFGTWKYSDNCHYKN